MSKKILIVDDEIHMRDLIERALEPLSDADVQFLSARGGIEAIEKATLYKPDMVILDIMMPDLSGIEVCSKVKKDGLSPYVLMLTAMGQKNNKIDALEVGADEYITKPFDPEYLLQRVSQIIKVAL